MDHLNTTFSLNTTTLPLSGDSSLARFLTRWCRSSATISEGCLYSIKTIKVVASKGSYRLLCWSRQIQIPEKNIASIYKRELDLVVSTIHEQSQTQMFLKSKKQ